eukprot:TRINITY_DN26203_c1_g1_i1.p1 TRINITY_DN26203_c1_g1~~TRINITY_DN26203_c1_g1_i1.p1  ORF type:complete len:116 (-),score=9.88 TRINITY_DN26203_c1_g1_i1:391-738(-)
MLPVKSYTINGSLSLPLHKRQVRITRRRGNNLVRVSGLSDQLTERIDDPVLKLFVKEPVAFFGGVFAGIFGLNLQEDPLRTWIESTAASAGVSYEVANRQVQQQLDNMKLKNQST